MTAAGVKGLGIGRIGEFVLRWGESLRWDDRRQRLYFVDCATRRLHWLENGEPPLHTLRLPGMPTGVVLTEGTELVVCLDDGLHVVDPDAGNVKLLAPYPTEMQGRVNDAAADGAGNLVTGTMNIGSVPRGLWWFSTADGWRQLDGDLGNANGPVVLELGGEPTLVFGDTAAQQVFAYPYPATGTAGARCILADYAPFGGAPDGAAADAGGGVWSCVLHCGLLAHLTSDGIDRFVDLPMANPSDVAFGGPHLDRLFVTSITFDLGENLPRAPEAGWLLALDVGVAGRPEARLRL